MRAEREAPKTENLYVVDNFGNLEWMRNPVDECILKFVLSLQTVTELHPKKTPWERHVNYLVDMQLFLPFT